MPVSVAAPITPSVLTWARQQAAVTVPELAKKADVKPERVLEWENGQASPTVAKLRSVADMLKQPMALFFAPSPPADGISVPPDYRAAGSTTGSALVREICLAEKRRDIFKELAPGLAYNSSWPQWRATGRITPSQARDRLGVTIDAVAATKSVNDALKLWIAAFEVQGILVFQMSRIGDTECSGLSLDDATTPVVVLNGGEAPQRRIFTLMHELGHLIDHSGALCLLEDSVDRERACNRFAESLLMPESAIRKAVAGQRETLAVDAVERAFRVSRVAAAVALNRHELVSQTVVDDEKKTAEARRRSEGRSGFAPPERLKRRNLGDVYLSTVLEAMDSEIISVADATYYLGAKVTMIDKLERELAGSTL